MRILTPLVVVLFLFISLLSLKMNGAHPPQAGCTSVSWALADTHHASPLLCNMTAAQHLTWWSQTFTGWAGAASVSGIASLFLLIWWNCLKQPLFSWAGGRRHRSATGPPHGNFSHPLALYWSDGTAQLRI